MTARIKGPPSAGDVARLFFDAVHSMNARSPSKDIGTMNETGLTIPQFVALHVLMARGACTIGEIADSCELSPAATSHLVDRLVRLGLVHRVEDAADRRQKRVTVTKAGIAMVDRLMRARLGSIEGAMGLLSPGTLAKIAAAMQAVLDELPHSHAGDEVHR